MTGGVYSLFLFFVFAFHLPRYLKEGRLKGVWREYLGYPPQGVSASNTARRIWIHAVSAGEMRLALRLAAEWRERHRDIHPAEEDLSFIFTTGTPAGKAVAKDGLKERDILGYAPADFKRSVRRFLEWSRPRCCVILETEIWPNRIAALKKINAPVFLVNARLSDKAFPAYKKFRALFKPTLERIQKVFAQSEEHRRRFETVGIPAERVEVLGNMKFDVSPCGTDAGTASYWGSGADRGFPIVLAASTHAGEEAALLEAFDKIRPTYPSACLVLAPRHLQRLAEVETLLVRRGGSWGRWSLRPQTREPGGGGRPSVILVDQWGILNPFYSEADIIYVGGSLVPAGGHNPVEPAVCGKAVLYGPHMHNFKDVDAEFCRAGAVWKLRDFAELDTALQRLASDADLRKSLGLKAESVVSRNRGAVRRTVIQMDEFMKKHSEENKHVSLG